MTHLKNLRFCLPLLAGLLLGVSPVAAKDDKPDFVKSMLDRVELGKPFQGKILILFPIVVKDAGPAIDVYSQYAAGATVGFSEPEFPDKRYDVAAKNSAQKPVLILGGTVLVGGERDRLVRHDCLLAPGADVQMRALPAASNTDIRKEAAPFQMGSSLAPNYLRKQANFGGAPNLVPTFIARNLEFRNEGDKRKSLAAIGQSKLLQQWNQQARDKLNEKMAGVDRGRIVGFISSMRGRIQGLEIYGDRPLLNDIGPSYLLGVTYSGAAVAIQAGNKKVELPGSKDPEANLQKMTVAAQKLLDDLRKARTKVDKHYPDGCVGERVQIQLSDLTRGRAVGMNGQLVHLAVFPHDPFESRLYGTAIHLPDEAAEGDAPTDGSDEGTGPVMSDPNRMGLAELSRWAGRGGRVTHAEGAALRGLGAGRGGMRGGGMRGGGGMGGGRRR